MSLGQIAARLAFPGLYKHENEVQENTSFNNLAYTISDHDKSPPKVARALALGLIRNFLLNKGYDQKKSMMRPNKILEQAPLSEKRYCTLLTIASLEFTYHNEIALKHLADAYRALTENDTFKNDDPTLYDKCLKVIELTNIDMQQFICSKQNSDAYLAKRMPELEVSVKWLNESTQFDPLSVPRFTSMEKNMVMLNLVPDEVTRITDYPAINNILTDLKRDIYF